MMKKISKEDICRKVHEEYELAKKFVSGHYGRYYKMMIDVADGEIWSDVFLDEGQYKIYHSDSVRSLHHQYVYDYEDREIENGYVDDAVRQLREAGWIIE